jgi:hypothetical protein
MVVDARRTLVWGTAAASIASAALLASSGGAPRIAGLVGDAARGRPVATARADAPAQALPGGASAAPATPAR